MGTYRLSFIEPFYKAEVSIIALFKLTGDLISLNSSNLSYSYPKK